MKSAILAAMLLAASSGTSFATDTSIKAPPASPPPIDNWTTSTLAATSVPVGAGTVMLQVTER